MRLPFSLVLLLSLKAAMASTLIEGTSTQFSGPDELLLDPATSVIAVDVFGSSGPLEVNGVAFASDLAGPVTANGATVTITASQSIDGWQTAPNYTGADATSTDNLEAIMHDIRYALSPFNLGVDISGLAPGIRYNVQLLFSENGSAADRHWDIAVDGKLVADDWTSLGATEDGGTSSADHGYAYTGVFAPGADGILKIAMGLDPVPADPNNTPSAGGDNNPILQAVIVHFNSLPAAPDDITLDSAEFAPDSPIGSKVGSLQSSDPNGGTHSYLLVPGTGSTDNDKFRITDDNLETATDFSALVGSVFSIRVQTTDVDGLSFEKALSVSTSTDTDSDNLRDSWELLFGTLADFTGLVDGPGPGAGSGDFDGDGSPDRDEFVKGTAPNNPDTDNDGLSDGNEVIHGTNPLLRDTDGDTIKDGAEVAAGTDPTKKDTDNDGIDDNLDPDPTDPEVRSFTKVIVGDIIEFTGPDDLNLDPSSAVIAVNAFGDVDLEVNGVTFQEDVTGGGTASKDGVTVNIGAANQITDWASPPPEYTGSDVASTDNLEIIMASIRWTAFPDPVSVDISGLNPGATYEIQLLTNEGRLRGRHWDIAVEDELVVDNYTSAGREGLDIWTETNGFAYVGEFEAPADGILNILMQQQFGGIDPRGEDNNPILQAVIVHETGPGTPFMITDLDYNPLSGGATLTWNSKPGRNYILEFSTTMLEPWVEIEDSILSQGDSTTFESPQNQTGPVGFYRIKLQP